MYPPPFLVVSQASPLQPYLGQRAHLSLSWLSHHFLALLLVVVSLIFLLSTIALVVADAKETLGAACLGVQGAADTLVSLPHFMADGVNEMNAAAVKYAVEGLAEVVDVSLLSIEQIAIFIIDMYRSLFLCLLDLAVHGSLELLISGVQEANEFITLAFQDARSEIQSAVSGINTALAASFATINKLPGVDIDSPSFDVPTLSSLDNVTFSSALVTSLENLNQTIPTLSELRATLDSLISTPIDTLRTVANNSLSSATISIESLPIPARNSVDLCSSLDTSFIDEIGHVLKRFLQISIVVLALVILLFVVLSALWERRRYAKKLEGLDQARTAWLLSDLSNPSHTFSTPNLLSFLAVAEHPTRARVLGRLGDMAHLTPPQRTNAIWFGSYIFHPAASMFLLLGLVGIVIVQIQLAVLEGPIRDLAQDKANAGVGGFSDSVLATVNSHMNASSIEFAASSNAVILGLQDGVNNDLFGWVNTTTVAMNDTLNQFYTGLTDVVTDFFGQTPLANISLDFVYCLIGSKVTGLEKALTFIHDHAHLSLPTVSPTILLLSPNRTAELTSSLTAPNSSVSTESIVDKMISTYASSLRQQRLTFVVCILLWVLVVFFGLIGLFWSFRGQEMWARRRWGASSQLTSLNIVRWKSDSSKAWDQQGIPMSGKVSRSPADLPAPQYTFPSPATASSARTGPGFKVTFPKFDHPIHSQRSDSKEAVSFPKQLTHKLLPSLPIWASPSSWGVQTQDSLDYETRELRTGRDVRRPFPNSGRVRGAVASMTGAIRKKQQISRNGSLTSLGPRRGSFMTWEDGDGGGDQIDLASCEARPVHDALASDNPSHQGVRLTISAPPPPAIWPNPPPRVGVCRQPSSYHPTSRPTVNPFSTPFDDPAVTKTVSPMGQNPFATPFDEADDK